MDGSQARRGVNLCRRRARGELSGEDDRTEREPLCSVAGSTRPSPRGGSARRSEPSGRALRHFDSASRVELAIAFLVRTRAAPASRSSRRSPRRSPEAGRNEQKGVAPAARPRACIQGRCSCGRRRHAYRPAESFCLRGSNMLLAADALVAELQAVIRHPADLRNIGSRTARHLLRPQSHSPASSSGACTDDRRL